MASLGDVVQIDRWGTGVVAEAHPSPDGSQWWRILRRANGGITGIVHADTGLAVLSTDLPEAGDTVTLPGWGRATVQSVSGGIVRCGVERDRYIGGVYKIEHAGTVDLPLAEYRLHKDPRVFGAL